MPATSRRTVITGIGVLSPIGLDPATFWQALGFRTAAAAVRAITSASTPPASLRRIAGELQGFDPKQYVDKKQARSLRMMARTIHLAVGAAQCALDDGKVDKSRLDPDRFGGQVQGPDRL